MKHKLSLTSTLLKVLAMLLITIDHIGLFVVFPLSGASPLYFLLRGLGRLGFPLYAFFVVEGVVKTKHLGKYLLRILGLLGFIALIQVLVAFTPIGGTLNIAANYSNFFNIFLTLFTGATTIAYFHRKKFKDVYLLLPLVAMITTNILSWYMDGIWQMFLVNEYRLYGIAIILGFYVARIATPFVIKSVTVYNNIENSGIDNEIYTQKIRNYLSSISLLFVNVVWYILCVTISDVPFNPFQTYSIFTGLILLMYNGQKGNQPAWFKWVYYLYYPTHLAILVLINFLLL